MYLNTIPKHLLNTSKGDDSTISLESVFQSLITFLVQKFSLISNIKNLPRHNSRLFPLVLLLVTREKTLTSISSRPPFRQVQSDEVMHIYKWIFLICAFRIYSYEYNMNMNIMNILKIFNQYSFHKSQLQVILTLNQF